MTLLCIGDSNTYGYDPRSYFGDRYPADIRWTERLGSWKAINCGMNGLAVPYNHTVFTDLIRSKSPDVVAVMLGTNDLLEGSNAETTAKRMEAFLTDIKDPIVYGDCTKTAIVYVLQCKKYGCAILF